MSADRAPSPGAVSDAAPSGAETCAWSGDRVAPSSGRVRPRGLIASGAPLSILFWGASFVATRIALEALHPMGLVAVRFAAGTALLVAILRWKKLAILPRRGDLTRCTLLGFVLGAHILIQGYGLRATTAINSGWIVGFSPVTIALGAQIFLRERLRATGWLGVLLASGGVFTVMLAHPLDLSRASLGDLLILSSCLTWTAYTLLSKGPVARNGALRVTAFAMGVGASIASIAALFTGFSVGPLTVRVVVALAFLGLLCSGVAFSLWLRAIDRFDAARVGAMLYFQPFVTLAASVIVLSEPVTWHAIVGGALVLLGVWWVSRGGVPVPARARALADPGPAPIAPVQSPLVRGDRSSARSP